MRALTANVGGAQPLGVFVRGALRTGGYFPNFFDQCLHQEYSLWQEILASGGLERLCLPLGQRPTLTRPWAVMPEEGREFSPQTQTLVSTVSESIETTVLSFDVPFGYDGVINYIVANILPPASGITNFSEGSGQITWRLKAAGRHLRDWGNVLTSRGSLLNTTPIPLRGLRIYSRNKVEMTVTLSSPSGLTPGAQLITLVQGWFYPR